MSGDPGKLTGNAVKADVVAGFRMCRGQTVRSCLGNGSDRPFSMWPTGVGGHKPTCGSQSLS
jgi:hypothetical protein